MAKKLVLILLGLMAWTTSGFAEVACRLYEDIDGKGAYLEASVGKNRYIGKSWNDRVSSVWIQNGYRLKVYEDADFEGKVHVLQGKSGGTLYNLTNLNFNDEVSSYSVEKETSDICIFYKDINGEGSSVECKFGRVSYVGNSWNDEISSVRLAEGYKLTVYEDDNFSGESRVLYGELRGKIYNLSALNFNDAMSSYVLEKDDRKSGKRDKPQEEFERDKFYCVFYKESSGKGAYLKVDELCQIHRIRGDWNDAISSVWVKEGYKVTVYPNYDLIGKGLALNGKRGGTLYNLADMSLNDEISSYSVEKYDEKNAPSRDDRGKDKGKAFCRFYLNAEAKGSYLEVGTGDVPSLSPAWNDAISSVWIRKGYSVTLYEESDFRGRSYILQSLEGDATYNLVDVNFNDSVSSFSVKPASVNKWKIKDKFKK